MCKSPEPSRSCIQRDRWKLHAPRPPHTFCTWTTSPFRFGRQALQSWLPKRRLHWKRPRKWSQGRQSPESFAPANSFFKQSDGPGNENWNGILLQPVLFIASHTIWLFNTTSLCIMWYHVHHDLPDSCDCAWNVFLGFSGCLVASIGMFVDVGHRWPAASTLPIL